MPDSGPSVRSEAGPLEVRVYTPDSGLRHPGQLLRRMLLDLWLSRGLAWRLFVRDTRAQYRQSALGYVWAFIPPLVASLPFVFLNAQGVIAIKGTSIPYAAFAMTGTIIWQVFIDALMSPLKSVSAARSMLTRINFPREAILLAGLGQVIFNCLIRLLLLACILAWFRIALPPTAVLFPLGIAALIVTGFMIGVALTPIGMLYTDVQQTIPVAALFLMFLTPVLYPQPETGLAAAVARWNPMTPLITATRDWLTVGATASPGAFVLVTGVSLVLLFAGWTVYRVALPHIIERMGN